MLWGSIANRYTTMLAKGLSESENMCRHDRFCPVCHVVNLKPLFCAPQTVSLFSSFFASLHFHLKILFQPFLSAGEPSSLGWSVLCRWLKTETQVDRRADIFTQIKGCAQAANQIKSRMTYNCNRQKKRKCNVMSGAAARLQWSPKSTGRSRILNLTLGPQEGWKRWRNE